jgi:hypothetical protein
MWTGQDLHDRDDPAALDPGDDPRKAIARRTGDDRSVAAGAPSFG